MDTKVTLGKRVRRALSVGANLAQVSPEAWGFARAVLWTAALAVVRLVWGWARGIGAMTMLRGDVWWIVPTVAILGAYGWHERRKARTEARSIAQKEKAAELIAIQAQHGAEMLASTTKNHEAFTTVREAYESSVAQHNADEAKHRQARDALLYGSALWQSEPLPVEEFHQMRHTVHALDPSLVELRTEANVVWAGLVREAADNPPLAWIAANIERCERRFYQNAFVNLRRTMDAKQDPRPILAALYGLYWEWRTAMVRFAAMLGRQITEIDGYQRWRSAEIEFAKEVERRISIPELHGVGETVARFEARFGTLAQEPTPAPTMEVGEFGQRVMALRLTSSGERGFLSLFFFADSLPMNPADPTTFLANDVYSAGEALVYRSVLTSAKMESPVIRFCLPELTKRAWRPALGSLLEPKKACIDIRLDAVHGSLASGGGARSSERH
jgi:hypothetical protein